IVFVVIEDPNVVTAVVVVVPGEDGVALSPHRGGRFNDKSGRTSNHFSISIQIIEGRIRRDKVVMIVADLKKELVEIPQYRKARCVLKPAIVRDVAERSLLNRVLRRLKPVMQIDAEIADENIKRKLRLRRHQDVIGIVIGVIEVKRIADTEV